MTESETLQQFEIRMSNFPPELSRAELLCGGWRIGQADKKVDFITILFVSTVCSAAAVRGREREPFPSRLNGPRLYLLTISWEGERAHCSEIHGREESWRREIRTFLRQS